LTASQNAIERVLGRCTNQPKHFKIKSKKPKSEIESKKAHPLNSKRIQIPNFIIKTLTYEKIERKDGLRLVSSQYFDYDTDTVT